MSLIRRKNEKEFQSVKMLETWKKESTDEFQIKTITKFLILINLSVILSFFCCVTKKKKKCESVRILDMEEGKIN